MSKITWWVDIIIVVLYALLGNMVVFKKFYGEDDASDRVSNWESVVQKTEIKKFNGFSQSSKTSKLI